MIIYKTDQELAVMRRCCRIVAMVLDELKAMVKPGIRTRDLNEYAEKRSKELGGRPAFKGYRGFPASLCTSVNEEIVHGIPSSRVLKEGDLVSLDFGVFYEGLYGDAAVTYPVGKVSERVHNLIETAELAFERGILELREGNRISDVSHAIQEYVESRGFSVIRTFVGHGIGHELHEEPQVPNFGPPGRGAKIRRGMTLAIEPMISMGDWREDILDDGWTAVTRDRSLSAHYEHTVAVTANGVDILSLKEDKARIRSAAGENRYA